MAVFWITEALPIAVTSLLPIILFPMTGLLYAKDVSSTYINVCEYWLSNMNNNANERFHAVNIDTPICEHSHYLLNFTALQLNVHVHVY